MAKDPGAPRFEDLVTHLATANERIQEIQRATDTLAKGETLTTLTQQIQELTRRVEAVNTAQGKPAQPASPNQEQWREAIAELRGMLERQMQYTTELQNDVDAMIGMLQNISNMQGARVG